MISSPKINNSMARCWFSGTKGYNVRRQGLKMLTWLKFEHWTLIEKKLSNKGWFCKLLISFVYIF